jgi:hypothetical protein
MAVYCGSLDSTSVPILISSIVDLGFVLGSFNVIGVLLPEHGTLPLRLKPEHPILRYVLPWARQRAEMLSQNRPPIPEVKRRFQIAIELCRCSLLDI